MSGGVLGFTPAMSGRVLGFTPAMSGGVLGFAPTSLLLECCDHGPVSGSVLIVDDDPEFQSLASEMLVDCGLVVAGLVDTAGAAIEAAGRLRPDAVLVDVGLPDGDGIALARELAALPWRPRILLTSTNPDAAGPSEVRRSSAEGFIPKSQLPKVALDRILGARSQ